MAAPVAYGRIIGGLVLVSLAIVASAGAVVWQARQHAIDQAFIRTEGLAYALKQHAARTFDATALAVSVVVKQVEAGRPADPAAIHRLIAEISNDAPQIRNILVSDETGAVSTTASPCRRGPSTLPTGLISPLIATIRAPGFSSARRFGTRSPGYGH